MSILPSASDILALSTDELAQFLHQHDEPVRQALRGTVTAELEEALFLVATARIEYQRRCDSAAAIAITASIARATSTATRRAAAITAFGGAA